MTPRPEPLKITFSHDHDRAALREEIRRTAESLFAATPAPEPAPRAVFRTTRKPATSPIPVLAAHEHPAALTETDRRALARGGLLDAPRLFDPLAGAEAEARLWRALAAAALALAAAALALATAATLAAFLAAMTALQVLQ